MSHGATPTGAALSPGSTPADRRHAVGGGFALAKGAERPFLAFSGSALSAKASGWADAFA
jgi:hypothetical protein